MADITPASTQGPDTSTSATPDYTSLDYDTPPAIRYLPTTAAYDLWATHYDHDGNFLQALDTIEMRTLFPRLLVHLARERSEGKPWKLVDLGCGTGRNTTALLDVPGAEVVAVDASEGMLEVARRNVGEIAQLRARVEDVKFGIVDLLAEEVPKMVMGADAIVSTLVLEHIPCDVFFDKVTRILKPGGWLLMTNMHSQMGGISQAGFVDPATGEKIRPTSYAHTVDETVKAAEGAGLSLAGKMEERMVDEALLEALGPRSRKWVGIWCWYGGIFKRAENVQEK
jgi:SAM-dependent methyltransferase